MRSFRRLVQGGDPGAQPTGRRETESRDPPEIGREARTGDTIQAERLEKLRAAVIEGQRIIATAWGEVATRLEVVRRHCDGRCADGVREELLQAIAVHQQLLNRTTRLLASVSELLQSGPPPRE